MSIAFFKKYLTINSFSAPAAQPKKAPRNPVTELAVRTTTISNTNPPKKLRTTNGPTERRVVHVPISPIVNTSKIANIIHGYLSDDFREASEILKEINKVFSSMNLDEKVLILSPDQVFYRLGEDAWKDIIDGRYHHLGPMVFDNPRPGHPAEPGFYNSMTAACLLASKRLFDPCSIATVETYQDIHKSACAHFKGRKLEDTTLIHGSKTGQFRWLGWGTIDLKTGYQTLFRGHPSYSKIAADYQKWSNLDEYIRKNAPLSWIAPTAEILAFAEKFGIKWDYNSLTPQEQFDLRKKHSVHEHESIEQAIDFITKSEIVSSLVDLRDATKKLWLNEYGATVKAKIDKLNTYIKQKSDALGVKDLLLAEVTDVGAKLCLSYKCPEHLINEVVRRIFSQFLQRVSEASTETAIRQSISDLYQMLEWVHPFPDGQGRTDLILLKTLLTAYGLTPAILDEPYTSSLSDFETWDAYLLQGMEKWKQQFAKKSAASA